VSDLSSDFISDFMDYSENLLSPAIYRRWSAICCVAGALERRCWAATDQGALFPNLYVLLVGPPGTGKFIIEEVRGLWTDAKEPGTLAPAFHVAPDSMTKAALIDELQESKSVRVLSNGQQLIYHSLLIAAEEFSIFMSSYDMEFVGVLNGIWNNRTEHKEKRRHGPKREVSIPYPQLNLLGGVQPAFLGELLPENAWATGLARRTIMVYSNEVKLVPLFGGKQSDSAKRQKLLGRLGALSRLWGQFQFTPEAIGHLGDWHMAGGKPVPTHSRLEGYVKSRTVSVIKLALVSSASRGDSKIIDQIDIVRALEWLFEAERFMPDIFRDMKGNSDAVVLEELHYFLSQAYSMPKNRNSAGAPKPLSGDLIWKFLSDKIPSQKIEMIILTAERSGMIARAAGLEGYWVPKPKPLMGFGVE